MKANYGIDRPDFVVFFAVVGGLFLALSAFSVVPLATGVAFGVACMAVAVVFVIGSKTVKIRVARDLLDSIPWRGDESVLDIGCGRGLMLITAAKHLRTGTAVGIDVWNRLHQSGNYPTKTMGNARVEGVADKVEVRDGDARHLPFRDESFNVVVSSLVFHHVPEKERRLALGEVVRVLKPGGHLATIELFHAREYAPIYRELGMEDIMVSSSRVELFFGGRTLTGRKALMTGKAPQ